MRERSQIPPFNCFHCLYLDKADRHSHETELVITTEPHDFCGVDWMAPAGEVLAHFGHLVVGFGYHLWKHSTYERTYADDSTTGLTLLIGSLLLLTFCSDFTLMIGLMTILELLTLLNSYLNPTISLLTVLSQYYFSLLTCSFCAIVSQQNPQRYSSIIKRIPFVIIHFQLFLLAFELNLNYSAFSICFLLANFLSLTSIHISGFESIILYWSMYVSSDWILGRLSTGVITNSLELTNMIGSCGLLSVLCLGMTLVPFLTNVTSFRIYFDWNDQDI
jgi:hypothetical protein